MRKRFWAAILLAGILGVTGITAFAVPEKEALENEASQSDADETEEAEEIETEKDEKPLVDLIPDRVIRNEASPSEPEETPEEMTEVFIYPEVTLREEEHNGTKGLYPYWDRYDGTLEPVAIGFTLLRWEYNEDGTKNYWMEGRNVEGYNEDRSFKIVGDEMRLSGPINNVMQSGDYQVIVIYIMDKDYANREALTPEVINEALKYASPESKVEISLPMDKAPAPTNVEADEAGRLSWDIPEGVTGFNVYLYNSDGKMLENVNMFRSGTSVQNFHYSALDNLMEPGQTYYYGIYSLSPDYEKYQNSDFVYSNSFTIAENNTIIEDVLSKDGDELVAAVEGQELSRGQMHSMKRDLTNNAVAETSYEELESKYKAETGLGDPAIVSGNGTMSAEGDEIHVLGGALNQITSVDFSRLNKEEAAEQMPENANYNNAVCIDISASTENEAKTELKWPVVITMKAPEDIPIELLRIIHFKSDGDREIIYPRDNGDGTISFAIDHFSLFVFYEAEQSSSSSSSGGSVSGPVGVYYADGRSASAAQTGTWEQDGTGWKYRLPNGSYPVSAWYQCDWNGKLLWYHFNAGGYLDSGWYTDTDGNIYYLHPEHDGNFGHMYTGWNTIEGKTYFFSVQSGDGLPAGALFRNGSTPDGHTVDANGVLIQ